MRINQNIDRMRVDVPTIVLMTLLARLTKATLQPLPQLIAERFVPNLAPRPTSRLITGRSDPRRW